MMKQLSKTILLPLGLFLSVTSASAQDQTEVLSEPAQPKWQICNETSFALRLATAHARTGQPTASGWDRLRAGSCLETIIDIGEPKFVFAESVPAHRGGIREWKGTVQLCTQDENFSADPMIGCSLQAMYEREFMAIDPDEPVTTLVEIENFGSKAQMAGIQRLLQDNGYDISRVDGIAGRRTSKTLKEFLVDHELPNTLSVEEQLDALEVAALEHIKTIGLTLCNKSSHEIWTAIGRRRKGNWESRGWWKIPAQGCEQVFTDSLINADLAFYAAQTGGTNDDGEARADKPIRTLAATPTQFCISDSRFSVLGKDNCADNGYRAANFRILPNDQEGLTIDVTDADFGHSGSGLR